MRPRKQTRRQRFLITAGGTREYIDPVRFISNASSGKMGYCLAKAAVSAGHKVTLISAPVKLSLPRNVEVIEAESADDMFKQVKSRFGRCDCLIMAAAVSDYTPVRASRVKIKRGPGTITLKLKPTKDILKWAGTHKHGRQAVIGFALEDINLKADAGRKIQEKNLDMIVANKLSAIGAEKTSVQIKRGCDDWLVIRNKSKSEIAREIIRLVEKTIC